jgi:saccharopine dehydrogenase (NADP+, L-glutamate forming)
MHLEVAQDCISLGKHMVTASYVSKQVFRLGDEARQRALVFMNELGLDPGIDHMSAMQRIHQIKNNGGKINAFYSYTGGLVAPESDDNPWHYKDCFASTGMLKFRVWASGKFMPTAIP